MDIANKLLQLNTNVNEINTEVGEQDALLEMINQALEGKVAAAVDRSSEDNLVNRTATEYINDRVEAIGDYAFYRMTSLQNASFANAKTIGSSAFYSCNSLATVNMPELTTVGSYAFQYCSKLSSITAPKLTSTGVGAFANCSSLTEISCPELTTLGSSTFSACYKLVSANLPKVTTVPGSAFKSCSTLTSLNMPEITAIGSSAFYGCSSLSTLKFSKLGEISTYAFANCQKLTSLYLLSTAVCALATSTVFNGTPMSASTYTGSYGSIYVPYDTISAYLKAPNWLSYSARIVQYEKIMTIGGTTYYFEPGMNWFEWVISKYNTGLFSIVGIDVLGSLGAVGYNGTKVKPTQAIIAGRNYSFMQV